MATGYEIQMYRNIERAATALERIATLLEKLAEPPPVGLQELRQWRGDREVMSKVEPKE